MGGARYLLTRKGNATSVFVPLSSRHCRLSPEKVPPTRSDIAFNGHEAVLVISPNHRFMGRKNDSYARKLVVSSSRKKFDLGIGDGFLDAEMAKIFFAKVLEINERWIGNDGPTPAQELAPELKQRSLVAAMEAMGLTTPQNRDHLKRLEQP